MTVPFLLTGSGAIKKQATKLYENADEIAKKQKLPMRASTGPIQNVLDEIGKYTKGAETEGIKAMNPMVKHIKKISKGANLDLEELWKTSQKINNNFKLYQQFPDSKRFIGKIQEGIKETLRGSKDKYPEFVNSALNATDMWHGLHSSSAVRDFMHSFSKSNDFKSNATKILLAFKSVPYALKAAVLGKGTVSIVDTMETLSKSPAARGYYFKTLQAALKENGPAYIKNAKLLDKEMQKLEQPQEDRYEILEWM
jgi:hypothetical protein